MITLPKVKTNPYLFEQDFTQNNESGLLKDILLNNEIMGWGPHGFIEKLFEWFSVLQ